jgi:hypothetical protein
VFVCAKVFRKFLASTVRETQRGGSGNKRRQGKGTEIGGRKKELREKSGKVSEMMEEG